jgi:hypothetical protein
MEAVTGGGRSEHRRFGQPGQQQAHAPEVEGGVSPGHRVRQHPSGVRGGQRAIGHDGDKGQLLAQSERDSLRPGLDHGGRHQAPEDTRRGILWVAVIGSGHGQRVLGPSRAGGGGGQGGRRSQSPRDGNLGMYGHGEAVVSQDVSHNPRRQVRSVAGQVGALTGAADRERRCRHDLNLHVAVQRDGEHIKSRPEVR